MHFEFNLLVKSSCKASFWRTPKHEIFILNDFGYNLSEQKECWNSSMARQRHSVWIKTSDHLKRGRILLWFGGLQNISDCSHASHVCHAYQRMPHSSARSNRLRRAHLERHKKSYVGALDRITPSACFAAVWSAQHSPCVYKWEWLETTSCSDAGRGQANL